MVSRWIIGKSVIDVGCGNKFITKCMSVYATVKGIDIDEDIFKYQNNDVYDVVTCFDVLEHVDGVYKALENIKYLCKIGGIIIINQPEQRDESQPIDNIVSLNILMKLGKLIYLENYAFSPKESYNFMVFSK